MIRVPERFAGPLAWLIPFGVYAASLEGAVGYWDTGEMQVVPWIFGIAHPTGFPAFTMLAGVFAHLFAVGPISWRIALFCAIAMSTAAWLVSRVVVELEGDAWIATFAAWIFAFGSVAWTRGTRAEVHALAAFFAVATMYASVRWYKRGEPRVLALGALAWGLGIATHPIVALLLPALLVVFIARLRFVTLRAFVFALAALVLGASCYAYLPARSAAVVHAQLDPTTRLGEPPGRPFWNTDNPSTWSGFKQLVSGEQFGAGGSLSRILQAKTYLSALPDYFSIFVWELTPLAVLFALGGIYALARTDATLACALVLAAAVPTAFAFGYTIEADIQRYYLISFAVGAMFAGYGASAAVRALPPLRAVTIAVFAGLAILLTVLNRHTFAQRTDQGARAVISTVLQKTPDDAILISPWLYATPLAYAAYDEHSLGHRVVETGWLSDDAARVPGWLRSRPVYVVGIVFGSVPGYKLVLVKGSPDLYRVVKS